MDLEKDNYRRTEQMASAVEIQYAMDLMEHFGQCFTRRDELGLDSFRFLTKKVDWDFFDLIVDIERLQRGEGLKKREFTSSTYELRGDMKDPTLKDLIRVLVSIPNIIHLVEFDDAVDELLKEKPKTNMEKLNALISVQKLLFKTHLDGQASMLSFMKGRVMAKLFNTDLSLDKSDISYPLNCDARAKVLISIIRKAFPDMDVYVDCIFLDGEPHIRPVVKLDGVFYALDSGVIRMNRPPSHLDLPEMVYASWYVESVLGESPFKLKTTVTQDDRAQAHRLAELERVPIATAVRRVLNPGAATHITANEMKHEGDPNQRTPREPGKPVEMKVHDTIQDTVDDVTRTLEITEHEPEEEEVKLVIAPDVLADSEEAVEIEDPKNDPRSELSMQRIAATTKYLGPALAAAALLAWLKTSVDHRKAMDEIAATTTIEEMPEIIGTFDPNFPGVD